MRYLTLSETLEIHIRIIAQTGGALGILNLGTLEAALAQPQMTFNGIDLYPTVVEKAAALGFSLIQNHPFVDGDKRVGQAAMEIFLVLNGYEISASADEQEIVMIEIASGQLDLSGLSAWLRDHTVPRI